MDLSYSLPSSGWDYKSNIKNQLKYYNTLAHYYHSETIKLSNFVLKILLLRLKKFIQKLLRIK